MIIDNKIDGLPLAMKVMTIVPLSVGSVMLFSSSMFFILLGSVLIILCIAGITLQERVTVNFDKRQIKTYYRILGIPFGQWKPLLTYHLITLTRDITSWQEVRYSTPSIQVKFLPPPLRFTQRNVMLHLKSERRRITIAQGRYEYLRDLALAIGDLTGTDVYDCIAVPPERVGFSS